MSPTTIATARSGTTTATARIASGGHTLLAHVREHDGFEVIGRTLDDAAGEALRGGGVDAAAVEALVAYLQHASDQDVARIRPIEVAKKFGVLRGLLTEAFEQEAAIMFRCQDLRTLSVNAAITDADFVHLIHQLGDQIKAKARAAESCDLVVGREDDARVLDRVLKIVVSHGSVD